LTHQVEKGPVVDTPAHHVSQPRRVHVVKGLNNLLPLSTTHSMTPWKS
jgi:hypothetical protein